MMKKWLILPVFLLLCVTQVNAQTIRLLGNAPQYANTTIKIQTYTDLFTKQPELLDEYAVAASGAFVLSFQSDEVKHIFIEVGKYRAWMYAEPDTDYKISLPDYEPISKSDSLNPFFELQNVYIGLENAYATELNVSIRRLDDLYYGFLNKQFIEVFHRRNFKLAFRFIEQADSLFAAVTNPYFIDYKNYRWGYLYHITTHRKQNRMLDEFFSGHPVLMHNPAYFDLFAEVSTKYLPEIPNSLFDIEQARSFSLLKKAVAADTSIIGDSLQELLILQGLHEGFYKKYYDKQAVIEVLDSLARQSEIAEYVACAKRMTTAMRRLMPGSYPPAFTLNDLNSQPKKMRDYAGMFVYLNFQSAYSYTSQQEMSVLKALSTKYKDKLTVLTICADPDLSQMKSLCSQLGVQWDVLHYMQQPAVLRDYEVKAYPTYYLIDPEGKLALINAPAPTEGFDNLFFELYTTWERDKKRDGGVGGGTLRGND